MHNASRDVLFENTRHVENNGAELQGDSSFRQKCTLLEVIPCNLKFTFQTIIEYGYYENIKLSKNAKLNELKRVHNYYLLC